jgi:hypothetical protein
VLLNGPLTGPHFKEYDGAGFPVISAMLNWIVIDDVVADTNTGMDGAGLGAKFPLIPYKAVEGFANVLDVNIDDVAFKSGIDDVTGKDDIFDLYVYIIKI